jgi:hypothetical protein
MAWPTVPGNACPAGVFDESPIRGWYFTLVIASYNVMDFAARCVPHPCPPYPCPPCMHNRSARAAVCHHTRVLTMSTGSVLFF